MSHADKDWIKLRAEMVLDVIEDAAQAHVSGAAPPVTVAALVETLYNNPKYMRVYADSLDQRLHGEPIPNEPIQR